VNGRRDVLTVMDAAAGALSGGRLSDSTQHLFRADLRVGRDAVNAAIAALCECESYLEGREDVIDGDYGQPAPNREMTLLREVRAALAACGVK
jgi:hypothetical protein